MSKKALMAVSFGTAYKDAVHSIENVEKHLKRAFPGHELYRAYTSDYVRVKIERDSSVHIPSPEEVLDKLYLSGYEEVLCQSLHILSGAEYEKLVKKLDKYGVRFKKFVLGKPLLYGRSDCLKLAEVLLDGLPELKEDEAMVYMGHGAGHHSNAAYAWVERSFRQLEKERVYVGAMEGIPGIEYIFGRLKEDSIKKVWLAPLLLFAGGHAKHDLAGNGKTSWKSRLESEGYEVNPILEGLGDKPGVGEMFAEKLRIAMY